MRTQAKREAEEAILAIINEQIRASARKIRQNKQDINALMNRQKKEKEIISRLIQLRKATGLTTKGKAA